MPSLDAPAGIVTARDISVRFGNHLALAGVDLDLRPGQVTALTGPNGAGKSTLLCALAGIQSHEGRIDSRPRSALVVQRSAVPDRLPVTALDAVTLGRWGHAGLWRRLRARDTSAVNDALRAVDLLDLAHRPLATLSGGQRQRVLVAQGLAAQAELLLLDEPTAGVDSKSRQLILDAIDREASRGAIIVHATHDFDAAERAAQIVELRHGRCHI